MFKLQNKELFLSPDLGQKTHDVLGSLEEGCPGDQMQTAENQFFPSFLIFVRCITTRLLLQLGKSIFIVSIEILENVDALVLGNNFGHFFS